MKYNRINAIIAIIAIILLIFAICFIDLAFTKRDQFETTINDDNITVVSGYWKIGGKHTHSTYDNWFKNSLKINQRYIFFCNESDVSYIKEFREGLETVYKSYPLDKFYSKKYVKDNWTDPFHVPSKEIAMIWHEKMHLLKIAKDEDENPTEFYIWVDAGVCEYRDKPPPTVRLNLKDVNSLPKDKLCYSHIDSYHDVAGTVLIIHRDAIDTIHKKYYEILDTCDNEEAWKCGSDQVNFTKLLQQHPELFFKMSEGWAMNLVDLYNDYV